MHKKVFENWRRKTITTLKQYGYRWGRMWTSMHWRNTMKFWGQNVKGIGPPWNHIKFFLSDPGNSYFMPDSMKESQAKLISLLKMKVPQSCLTLCDHDPMDYTVHSILQARILKWVAFSFSRGSSQPRDWIQVSHIADWFFTSWATREAQEYWNR